MTSTLERSLHLPPPPRACPDVEPADAGGPWSGVAVAPGEPPATPVRRGTSREELAVAALSQRAGPSALDLDERHHHLFAQPTKPHKPRPPQPVAPPPKVDDETLLHRQRRWLATSGAAAGVVSLGIVLSWFW